MTPPDSTRIADDLRRFLNVYWLRPENAFWMVLRSHSLLPFAFDTPSADISCGDGCFTFLHAGGAFEISFDVFGSVGRLDEVRDKHADMFDHVSAEYRPAVTQTPAFTVSFGTDWKQALLDKASRLGVYEALKLHDSNSPLPFSDESLATVYCNSAYWVREIDAFLRELRRVTKPGGKLLLQVKLDSIAQYTLEAFRGVLGDRWLDIIGRGRVETWPTLADRATWEQRFAVAGLKIESAVPFITRTHAHIWDIGLRPIAPMLVRMANGLAPQTRTAIKKEWIELFVELLLPFTRPDADLFAGPGEPGEILYVLRP